MMSDSLKKIARKDFHSWFVAAPFVLPGLILVAAFVIYPMVFTIRIALSEYQIVQGTITFSGIDNFVEIFSDSNGRFWYALRNNLLYGIVTTPPIIIVGMILAYLVNNIRRGSTFFKVALYLPVITSWVIVSLVFTYMFNNSDRGLFNYLLVDVLHISKDYIPWLLREWTGNFAIWLMGVWKNVGWAMIIYLAALQGIPPSLYEAASLDGAGLYNKFRHIVLPSLRPTTFFVMVNMVIGSFNVFIQVMLLTGGGPNGRTSVLQYMLYDAAFNKFEFGVASAIGMLSAIFIVALTVILNRTLKLDDIEDGGAGS
jgi:multiple sugar transport system permease protein